MRTAPPQRCCAWQEDGGPALVLPGRPWAVRLAGRDPAFGALEVYEAEPCVRSRIRQGQP